MHYAISDIHNDYKKFCEMLDKIQFSQEDHLYIVGDVFDRTSNQPNPVDLYFKILSLGERCTVICGNHDHWLACYIWEYYALSERLREEMRPYSYNTFELLRERLTPVDIQTLAKRIMEWPLQVEVEVGGQPHLLAHAMTYVPEVQKPEEYYLMGSSLSKFYLHYGIAGYISICGHTVTDERYIWKNRRDNLYMIDCGCGFPDGRLGCLCLETKEMFYAE